MQLKCGTVLSTFTESITPPKQDFMICICPDLRWFLLVNSEDSVIYEGIEISTKCIKPSLETYSFLMIRVCIVGCSRFFTLSNEDLQEARFIGEIDQAEMRRIYDKIRQSSKWSLHSKAKLFKYLY